jgi:Bacterial protein of unknown function (DUF922)
MKPSLIILFIIFSYSAFTQKIIISGEETNRKLAWSDFTGKVDKNSSFLAHTGYLIKYKAEDIKAFGDSISIGKFEVILELDPVKSWANRSKVTDDLLTHEQGHFDISIVCVREIMEVYKQTRFTRANINATLENMVNTIRTKYDGIQLKYDSETDHSKNKEQQAKWNQFIAEQLNK